MTSSCTAIPLETKQATTCTSWRPVFLLQKGDTIAKDLRFTTDITKHLVSKRPHMRNIYYLFHPHTWSTGGWAQACEAKQTLHLPRCSYCLKCVLCPTTLQTDKAVVGNMMKLGHWKGVAVGCWPVQWLDTPPSWYLHFLWTESTAASETIVIKHQKQ